METRAICLVFSFSLATAVFVGCEEQKEQALEYFNRKPAEGADSSKLERFGFEDKPTAVPTSRKIVIPFDNDRTRQDANSN